VSKHCIFVKGWVMFHAYLTSAVHGRGWYPSDSQGEPEVILDMVIKGPSNSIRSLSFYWNKRFCWWRNYGLFCVKTNLLSHPVFGVSRLSSVLALHKITLFRISTHDNFGRRNLLI